jgi:hypothetical protein
MAQAKAQYGADSAVAATATGVPDTEIEIALDAAFGEWWSRNSYALEDGGAGDIYGLLSSLIAACAKARRSV